MEGPREGDHGRSVGVVRSEWEEEEKCRLVGRGLATGKIRSFSGLASSFKFALKSCVPLRCIQCRVNQRTLHLDALLKGSNLHIHDAVV